jgi:hypothetical protein
MNFARARACLVVCQAMFVQKEMERVRSEMTLELTDAEIQEVLYTQSTAQDPVNLVLDVTGLTVFQVLDLAEARPRWYHGFWLPLVFVARSRALWFKRPSGMLGSLFDVFMADLVGVLGDPCVPRDVVWLGEVQASTDAIAECSGMTDWMLAWDKDLLVLVTSLSRQLRTAVERKAHTRCPETTKSLHISALVRSVKPVSSLVIPRRP